MSAEDDARANVCETWQHDEQKVADIVFGVAIFVFIVNERRTW